jgi:D-amino-acid dehydrogenase
MPLVVEDFHITVSRAGTGTAVTGIDELATPDAAPRFSVTKRIMQGARTVFPELNTEDASPWMHCRPSMPDSLPVIGAVPGYPNAFMAFGHGHKGLGMGGITGSLVRQLVDGETPDLDLEPYSPLRFSKRRRRQATVGPSIAAS